MRWPRDAPAARRLGADALDRPDRLVTRNERSPAPQPTRVLLVVRTAQPARLDPHQRARVADFREFEM